MGGPLQELSELLSAELMVEEAVFTSTSIGSCHVMERSENVDIHNIQQEWVGEQL